VPSWLAVICFSFCLFVIGRARCALCSRCLRLLVCFYLLAPSFFSKHRLLWSCVTDRRFFVSRHHLAFKFSSCFIAPGPILLYWMDPLFDPLVAPLPILSIALSRVCVTGLITSSFGRWCDCAILTSTIPSRGSTEGLIQMSKNVVHAECAVSLTLFADHATLPYPG